MPVRTGANVNISPLRDAVEPPQAVALLDKPLPFREAPEVIMANLSWARWVGVALGAFAMACGSSARRFPATQSFTWWQLRKTSKPSASERKSRSEKMGGGRRNPRINSSGGIFDGLLDDGTVVVVWFGDNWFYGSHKRAVSIQLTPPGKPTRQIMRTFDDPGVFSSDHADVQIGPHSFKGDLETYAIHVDATETGGAFRAEMKSCRRAARATSAIARAQGNRPPPTGPTTLKVVTDGLRAEYCQFEEIVK